MTCIPLGTMTEMAHQLDRLADDHEGRAMLAGDDRRSQIQNMAVAYRVVATDLRQRVASIQEDRAR